MQRAENKGRMVIHAQLWGCSEHRAAMFTGLGSVFYKGQDRSFHLCQAAAGHGAPGSLLVFHTLPARQLVRRDPKSHLTQSHQVD